MTDSTDENTSPQIEEKEYLAQVKWYNPRENYGFATILDTNEDIFIHKKSIIGNSVEEERFWNKCLFKGEFISMTLQNDNDKITGVNIKSSLKDENGHRESLLFADSNMKSYVNRFRERWSKSKTWNAVSN